MEHPNKELIALGVRQPWAELILRGIKTIEVRTLPTSIRGPVFIGFIGAYTTFSTLMLESWRLIEGGAVGLGLANLVGSSVIGMVALVGGLMIGRALA